jgi:hypothetical protein
VQNKPKDTIASKILNTESTSSSPYAIPLKHPCLHLPSQPPSLASHCPSHKAPRTHSITEHR